MNFASFLVIGVVGIVFLIALGHIVRGQHGARAQRRFWLRMVFLLLGVGVTSAGAYWLLPDRFHSTASLGISGASLPVIWYLFWRHEQPTA
jgi:multisubunit Na+/H+ antiporter MnhB subunit